MKNLFLVSLIVACAFSVQIRGTGQIVSNLSEANLVNSTLASAAWWRATSFTTDATAYTLDSVTVRFGPPSGFGTGNADATVTIYSDSSSQPGTQLESLGTQTANSAGDLTFNSAGLSLSANTIYWLVVKGSAGQPTWSMTGSANQTGSWTIGDDHLQTINSGGTWTNPLGTQIGQFSMSATPVPEPQHYALVSAVAMIGFALWRRTRRPALVS